MHRRIMIGVALFAAALTPARGLHAADIAFTTADSIATLQDVIDACSPGDRILLGDGLYQPGYTINLVNGVTLAGSNATNCVIRPTGSRPAFTIEGAGSCISNLTVTGGKTSGWNHGAGIVMRNGVIAHCIITNNVASGGNARAGGILLLGGTVHHSTIAFNTCGSDGGGIYIGNYGHVALTANVLIDRCLIVGNTAVNGGGIFANGQNATGGNKFTLRHCTVAGNTATSAIGGAFFKLTSMSTVESCIFADNVQKTEGTQKGKPNWQIDGNTTSDKFKNCLFGNDSATTGTAPVTKGAAFKSLVNGDYHLNATSGAIDAGLVSANVTEDLDGNPVTDGHPDIGCYEFDLSREPFSCILTYSASSIFQGATVSLSATPVNPPAGVTLRYVWTLSDGGENVITATGAEMELTLANTGTYTVVLRAYDAGTDTLLFEETGESSLPIYAQTIYVEPGDDLPAICAGLVDGQRLFLAEGTFPITKTTSINAGVEVIGAGRDATILQLGTQNVTFDVSHIYASLSGVTIRGAYSSGGRHTITIQRGVLRDSRVTQCGIYGATYGYAPLFIDNGGLVERCVIDNNTNKTTVGLNTWVYTRAGAVLVKNGKLRNCLVHHNYASGSDGTVYIGANNGGDGLVENCTIVDNLNAGTTLEAVALLIGNNGYVRNTIVARNSSPNWTSTHTDSVANQTPAASPPNWAVRNDAASWTSRATYNCWGESAETYGSYCADGAKISFINPAGGNWRIGVNSSCRDAGLNDTWMATAIDLAGNPRIFHDTVDLGCYENQSRPTTVIMLR